MKTHHVLASALLILAVLSNPAQAQTTVTWTGGTGNWSNTALWSPAVLPNGVLYNVLLDNGNVLNSIVSLDTSVTIGGLTVDAGDTLGINNAVILTLSNALVNNAGIISLNSIGSGALIYIDGTVTFQGAGKVMLGTGGGNTINYSGNAGTDNVINKQTIEGRGDINVLLNNQSSGVIDANLTGQTLNVLRATTNGGTLRASSGGTLSLGSIAVANTGGVITATSGGTVYLNNSTITGGTLTNSGGTLYSGNLTTLDGSGGGGITLNGTYTLANTGQSILKGTINNNNLIAMNSLGSGTALVIDGSVNLQGAGKVTMNNAGSNTIVFRSSAGTDTLNSFQTIEGRGDINVLFNNTAGQLVDANVSGQYLSILRATTNSGTLRASNGGILSLNSIAVANAGSVITATSGGTVYLNNSTITGGTLTNSGGTLYSGNLTTLDGSGGGGITLNGTYTLANTGQSILKGTINNNNLIAMNSIGSGTTLYIDGTVNLQGAGKVTMNNGGSNVIRYNGAPGTDTLNNYQTIEGRGTLDVNVTNQAIGLIDANVSGGTLTVARTLTNTGTMQSSGGGHLSIATTTINNVGGTIQALAGSSVGMVSGASVIGGTVKNLGGTVTLAGVTLNGTDAAGITLVGAFGTPNASSVTLVNSVYNTGTISMNSIGSGTSFIIGGDGTGVVNLRGSGTVTLGAQNGGADTILASTAGNRLINENNTIQGRGVIGNGTAKLTNMGVIDANNATGTLIVNPQTGSNVNSGTMRASSGGTLNIQSSIANFSGVTIGLVESTAGSIVQVQGAALTGGVARTTGTGEIQLSTGSITGGSLQNSATGKIRAMGGTSTINGLDNAAGGQVIIENTSTLVVQGTLQNAGTIRLNSIGSGAELHIDGTVTLQGAGTVTMTNNGSNIIRDNGTAATDTLISQQTIVGRGDINVLLNNQSAGVVDANLTGQTLNVLRATTNGGTLRASNSGVLSLGSIAVANTGGTIRATSGGTVYLNNSTITGGTLTNSGGTLYSGNLTTLDGSGGGSGITLNGTYTLANTGQSILKGTINNNNLIAMNSIGSGTALIIDGAVNLQGAGKVTMSNGGSNVIRDNGAPATDMLNSHQTIEGRGDINVLFNNTTGQLVDANVSGQFLSILRATTNSGILRASDGGILSLNSIAVANTGGLITATSSGSTVYLNNSTITGGTLTNSGGTIFSGNLTTLDGTGGGGITLNGTYTLANTGQSILKGTINNNNLIAMNSIGSGTALYIDGTVNLQGTNLQGPGKVTMSSGGSNVIVYRSSAGTDTLNNNQTIEGNGTLNVNLTNQATGLIDANVSGGTLAVARNLTNTGLMQSSGGGTLSIATTTINNVGGTIQALTGSSVGMVSGARVNGGTVKNLGGTVTLAGVTLDGTDALGITLVGPFGTPNAFSLTLVNTVYNTGTISMNSIGSGTSLFIGGDGTGAVTLRGNGTITLGALNSDGDTILASTAGNRLNNENNTIQGRGVIGSGNMKLTNGGLILANVSGQTLTVTPQNVAGAGINTGIMRASGGGLMTINNTIENNGGLVEAAAGSIVTVQNGTVQSAGVGTPGTVQTIGTGEVRLSNGQILNGSLLNSSTGVIRSVAGTSRINTLNNAAGGQVIVNNATTLALQGTLTNNGSILLNSIGSGADLNIEGAVTLLGTGEVTLGTGGSNRLGWGTNAASDLLTNPQQHIQGMGMIDVKLTNQSLGVVDGNVTNQTLAMNRDVTNTGKLQASNSGILSLESIAVANTSGLITATSGGTVYLRNSTITGGTLTNAGGTIYSGNLTTLDGSGGGITLNGTYTLDNVGQSILKGTINNNNQIAMNSGGSGTTLFIDGAVSLQGDGRVTMNNASTNVIRYNTNPATDVLYNHQTIQGRGDINVLLYNYAGELVDANVTGETLSISRPTTNEGALNLNPADGGFLRASNGGTLSLGSIYVGNSRATIQALGAGATVLMNNSTIYGGVIQNAGGTILSGTATFLDGTAPDAITLNGTYTIANTGITALKGTINNNNLIAMNSLGSGTGLYVDGTVTLQGAGKVTMNNGGSNTIRYNGSPGSDLLINKQTIEGKGTIDVLFQNDNGRIVDANVNGDYLLMTRQVANNGYLQASNGGILQLNNIYVANTSAVIQALAGSSVLMTGSTIYGGYVVNNGGGVYSGNNTWLDGTDVGAITVFGAYTIGNAQTTVLKGTMQNEGQINLVSGGSGSNLRIDGIVNLQGGGTVTMNNNGSNHIYYNGSAATDGLNNFQTIEGRGSIDVIIENKSSGVVNGNIAGQTLTIDRDVTNRGILRAENGGTLSVNAIGLSTGQIDSRAGSQVSFNSPSFLLDQGTTITGVSQTRLVGGTTFIGDSQGDTIPTSNLLITGGTLTGPGTMNVSGSFTLTAGTVTGSGDLDLLAGSTNIVNGSSSTIDARPVTNHGTLTLAVNSLTMRGGAVLSNHGTLNVQGGTTVNGNANGGSSIDNHDLLQKTGSGTATLNTSFANTGTVEVQSGTLVINGTSVSSGAYVVNNDANFSNLDFGSGTHNLNAGASITGTGQARINGGGTVNVNAETHAADIALISGVIQGPGNLIVDRHMYWGAATMYGSGQTIIASGATIEIATGSTKFLHGRDLINYGTVNWSGGTIEGSDGGNFINRAGSNMGVTGNVTFTRADETSEFINNGNLAVPVGTSLTINSDFTNNGRVEAGGSSLTNMTSMADASAAGGTLTVTGNIKGNGVIEAIGSFLNWITGGIFAPKTVSGTTTVSGGGQLSIQGPGVTTIQGAGSGIVAGGGGNIVAGGGGNIVAAGGGNIVAGGGGNIVAGGGGNIVAGGGGNIVAGGGGNITHNGPGNIEAQGGGIVAAGGGNIVAGGGGNIVAGGGGNIVAGGGGNIVAAGGGNIVAAGGGNIVAAGGGNVISHNGNAIVAGKDAVLTNDGGLSSASVTGPIILAESGGNLIGHTGGTFTGNMVAQSGGSLLPGDIGAAGVMSLTGNLDLQNGSILKMDLLSFTQGTGYDLLNVAGTVAFNGNLLVNMAFALRTLASTDLLTLVTATSPITGTVGNLTGNRVSTANGQGSFKVTYGTNNNLVLDDYQPTLLTYSVWQSAWSLTGSPGDFNADPDSDGAVNGLEYGLGMDPMNSDADLLPIVGIINVSGVNYLALTYVRMAGVNTPTDLTFTVERSTTPGGGWSITGVVQQSVAPGPGSGFETVIMRSTTPVGAPGNEIEFLRMKVARP